MAKRTRKHRKQQICLVLRCLKMIRLVVTFYVILRSKPPSPGFHRWSYSESNVGLSGRESCCYHWSICVPLGISLAADDLLLTSCMSARLIACWEFTGTVSSGQEAVLAFWWKWPEILEQTSLSQGKKHQKPEQTLRAESSVGSMFCWQAWAERGLEAGRFAEDFAMSARRLTKWHWDALPEWRFQTSFFNPIQLDILDEKICHDLSYFFETTSWKLNEASAVKCMNGIVITLLRSTWVPATCVQPRPMIGWGYVCVSSFECDLTRWVGFSQWVAVVSKPTSIYLHVFGQIYTFCISVVANREFLTSYSVHR